MSSLKEKNELELEKKLIKQKEKGYDVRVRTCLGGK